MKVCPINNTTQHSNFNGKLKSPRSFKNAVPTEITLPIMISALTAQLLKEQSDINSNINQKGYIPTELTKEELSRAKTLANCFNYYKNENRILLSISNLMSSSKPRLNDVLFIKNFFDFLQNDMPIQFKVFTLDELAKPENYEFNKAVLLNFSTLNENFDDIVARFTIQEIMELLKIYKNSSNKKLVTDLIRDYIGTDDPQIKIHRFELDEIEVLTDLYKETPHKELLLTLLSQKRANKDGGNYPLYNTNMILNLITNCISLDCAKFLTSICSEKINTEEGLTNRFTGNEVFILRNMYEYNPNLLEKLLSQKLTDKNGTEYPRFNVEQINFLITAHEILGDTLIKLVMDFPDRNDLNFSSLKYIIEQLITRQPDQITPNKKIVN